jgi:hypothetical protein
VPFYHEISRYLADLEKIDSLKLTDHKQRVLFLIVCHLSIADPDPVGTASLSDPDLYQFQPNVKIN